MDINEAYQTLRLEKGASEPEIKKACRKLSLQYHPERNDNSAESQSEFAKIQEAYQVLSKEWPIKEYIGFSEAEIEEFIATEAEKSWYIGGNIFSITMKIKGNNAEDISFYSTPEQNKIYKNWLNHLHLLRSLGYSEYGEEVESLIHAFDDVYTAANFRKREWEKVQQNYKDIFSEPELEKLLKRLRETKDTVGFGRYVWGEATIKKIEKEIEESHDSLLLSDIINVELGLEMFTPPYQPGEDYWISLIRKGTKSEAEIRLWNIERTLTDYNYKAKLIKEKACRYYEILELPEGATLEEVKTSYRKLAARTHSDKKKKEMPNYLSW